MNSWPPRPRRHLGLAWHRVAAGLAAAAFLAVLAGCAANRPEPAAEVLDRQTGVTLVHMPRAVELLATAPRGQGADPFAYAAPFATNRMGATSYYIWIAVPGDAGGAEVPLLYADSAPLALEAIPPDLAALGLSTAPYERPAPWSAEYYFRIDAPSLRALAQARSIGVVTHGSKSGETRFEGSAVHDLTAFVERLGTD